MSEHSIDVMEEQVESQEADSWEHEEVNVRPPMDVYDEQDAIVVVVDMPGVDKKDLSVEVERGTMTIHGRSKPIAPGAPIGLELPSRNFYRQFELMESADENDVKAEIRDGVLVIQLGKKEEVKPRQIKVNVA